MNQDSTQLDLIRLVYNETNSSETNAIQRALRNDWEMKQEYKELLAAKKALPKVTFDPSNDTLSSVLRYSKSTAMETSIG